MQVPGGALKHSTHFSAPVLHSTRRTHCNQVAPTCEHRVRRKDAVGNRFSITCSPCRCLGVRSNTQLTFLRLCSTQHVARTATRSHLPVSTACDAKMQLAIVSPSLAVHAGAWGCAQTLNSLFCACAPLNTSHALQPGRTYL